MRSGSTTIEAITVTIFGPNGLRADVPRTVGLGAIRGITFCEGTIADLALKIPGVCIVRSWNALELEPVNRADT